MKHNSLESQIKCHNFICEDTLRQPSSCEFILYRYKAYSESPATSNLSGIYTLTCQKILGNPY